MNLVPQIGFFELILIAVIALIVVGPRDLPKLMRTAGKAVGHARRMASEFTSAFNQMAREAEMEDMRQEIENLKRNNPLSDAKRAVDDAVRPVEQIMRDETNVLRDAQLPHPEGSAGPGPAERLEGRGGRAQDEDEETGAKAAQ